MNVKDSIRSQLGIAEFMLDAYVADLTPAELLMRPAPDANHTAWQLGHLIASEVWLVEAGAPGTMPALPGGFAERHSKDTAASDKPADFLSKDEYLKLAKTVRAGTLQVLDNLSEADLDKPVAGRVPPFVKWAGDSFVMVGAHWLMHSGQWVVLRRTLGRDRKF
jgi:DinB superfamily